ncbi:hypothetical protein [Natrinema halophilum]|uniref:Uncharacterized protein n=1 Tax=Natrinema halophilum TaxID=1699371 RepID=A0A7D5GGC4_9EURY|nr:hypothetical protein [Natrinema halophilum]QLG48194.1 hypothetical protein HYG82_04690 [Natrinema halophilum]
MSRMAVSFAMGARQIRRTPVLLGLLVFLPAYLVGVFTYVAPDSTVAFELVGGETVRVSLAEVFPAFTTPMVASLLAGISGLFLIRSTADADARLVIAGHRPFEVILARLALLTGISTIATLAAVGVMRVAFAPERLGWFAAAVLLTALIYGTFGVTVGTLLVKLPGVYLVLFGSMIDLFLFQNPLATETPNAATLAPGYYPLRLAMDAGFSQQVDLEPLVWSLGVLTVFGALAVASFSRSVRV